MEQDPHTVRFFTYLSLFTTFMFLLVLGDNLFILFLGWEGVGLCSYLLINFWFTRLQANKAALKAMMVNRVGDVSFIAAGGLSLYLSSSLNFPTMLSGSI
jgi:NADH-ubiquinone oxidoreductase chain 5